MTLDLYLQNYPSFWYRVISEYFTWVTGVILARSSPPDSDTGLYLLFVIVLHVKYFVYIVHFGYILYF